MAEANNTAEVNRIKEDDYITGGNMTQQQIVSEDEWLIARKELLAKEKEFTRLRDELTKERSQLPWVRVDKEYMFDSARGKETLWDLFQGKSQLIVYHFMFGPDWDEGCPSCSYLADHFDGMGIHLNHRDISFVAVSRAKLEKLEAYKKRMGWDFKWMSSHDSDFNFDYNVSFNPGAKDEPVYYNYVHQGFPSDEAPGISVFVKNEKGEVFHSYSCYARGLDMLIGAYNYMDLTPKGRDEDGLPYTMDWLRRHDQYED